MEEGENLPFRFPVHRCVSARLNDEQNRLVFKTPTWIKTLHMHGFLILSLVRRLLQLFTDDTRLR